MVSCLWCWKNQRVIRISAYPLLRVTTLSKKIDLQVSFTPDGTLTTKIKHSHSHSTHPAQLDSLISPWICWRGYFIFRLSFWIWEAPPPPAIKLYAWVVFYCVVAFRNLKSLALTEACWEHPEVYLRVWEEGGWRTHVSAHRQESNSFCRWALLCSCIKCLGDCQWAEK